MIPTVKYPLISPSILSADFANLAREIKMVEEAGADWIHVDVMDGHFVPNITIGPIVVKWLKKYATKPLDVHVMISDPLKYAEDFAKAGAWGLTFHVEAVQDPKAVIDKIASLGMKPGLSLKPKTPASQVFPYLEYLNLVLVMTVEPGFGGQAFIGDVLPKIEEIASAIKEKNVSCLIEVDGGIDPKTAPLCVQAGAQVLVAGNAIFNAPHPVNALRALKDI